jgi:hypothetical protein
MARPHCDSPLVFIFILFYFLRGRVFNCEYPNWKKDDRRVEPNLVFRAILDEGPRPNKIEQSYWLRAINCTHSL